MLLCFGIESFRLVRAMDFEKYESNRRIHQLQSFFNQKISADNGYNFTARNQSNASYSKSKLAVRRFLVFFVCVVHIEKKSWFLIVIIVIKLVAKSN